jgi:Flp pilus assembly protein TadD
MNNMKIIALLLSLCILTSCIASKVKKPLANSENKQTEEFQKQASIAEAEHNYAAALESYIKLKELQPNSDDIKLKLADCYRLTGNCGNAKEIYAELLQKESISSNQENAVYLHIFEAVGMCMIQDGEYADAIDALSSIFEIDAMRWRTVNALGVAYALSGNNQESEKYFQLALALETDQYIVYNNMALASAFAGKYEDAIKHQKQAIMLTSDKNQNFERLELNLALLFGLSGKMSEAEEILRKYLAEDKVQNNLKYYAHLHKNASESQDLLKKSLGAVNSN